MNFNDLTNKKFGLLLVKEHDKKRSRIGKTFWICDCDCGNKGFSTEAYRLQHREFPNCGCKTRELRGKSHSKINNYDLSNEYGIGYTSNTNTPFYFDLEDYEKIKDYCWYENKQDGYIRRPKKDGENRIVLLHKFILEIYGNDENNRVDHIDKKRNNCRKYNLRKCTHHQNNMNKGLDNRNKSGISGVIWNKSNNCWQSYISYNEEKFELGCYDIFNDAVKTRLLAENTYYKEYAPQQHLWEEFGIINDGIYPCKKTKCKKIICLENGIIYNSCKECAEIIKLRQEDVARCARNERYSTHGYHFKYV